MVVEYVTGLKTAWEVAKALKSATDAIDDAGIKMQTAELISALADAKIEAAESTERIAELEKTINLQKAVTYEAPYYWVLEDESKDGPYCQKCQDDEKKLIRLQQSERAGVWRCHCCKTSVKDNNYVPNKPLKIKNRL